MASVYVGLMSECSKYLHAHLRCVTGYLSPRTLAKENDVKKSKIKSQCDERKLFLNISSPHYLTKKNNAKSRGTDTVCGGVG